MSSLRKLGKGTWSDPGFRFIFCMPCDKSPVGAIPGTTGASLMSVYPGAGLFVGGCWTRGSSLKSMRSPLGAGGGAVISGLGAGCS